MDRRELLKRSGFATAGLAVGAALPRQALAIQSEDGSELIVWDTLNDPVRSGIMESLAESFAEQNEGVTVEHQGWSTDELTNTLPQAVDSEQGPAIAQVNNGESLTGPMVRGELLVSLNPYVEEYGWDDILPEGLLARNRYTEDGTTFGEGELWGISSESEIVGFYYRRSVFEEHGLEVPTTFEEFETLLGALQEAEQEPLVFGNLDGWQAIHLFGEVHGTYTTREYLDGLIYRSGDQSFEDESIIDAANKVIEWNENGYFLDGYDGISGDDATALFAADTGAMLLQGSWAAGQVGDALGDDVGFFLMPPHEDGGTVYSVGGVGIPYSITTNAADPDLAAAFINHLVSDEAFDLFIEAGSLPAGEIPEDNIAEGTLSGELYTAWNEALADDAVGHYMDWASPDFYDVIVSELQQLLGEQTTSEEFAAALQETYAASFDD